MKHRVLMCSTGEHELSDSDGYRHSTRRRSAIESTSGDIEMLGLNHYVWSVIRICKCRPQHVLFNSQVRSSIQL